MTLQKNHNSHNPPPPEPWEGETGFQLKTIFIWALLKLMESYMWQEKILVNSRGKGNIIVLSMCIIPVKHPHVQCIF